MDPKLLTWFSYICWILIDITSRARTSWVWISFPKWPSSASSILIFIISYTDICTLEISGCSHDSIELMRLFIWFRVALSILTSFLEDYPSLFTSKVVISESYSRLLGWSHLWTSVFIFVVSKWVRYWLISLTNLTDPHDVLSCYCSIPGILQLLEVAP